MYDPSVRIAALALSSIALLATPVAAQEIAPLCEIRGRATFERVHVSPGRLPEVVRIDAREVALTPLSHGLWHVRTLDAGRALDGTTDEHVVFVLTRRLVVGPMSIAAGAQAHAVTIAGDGVRADITIADGARVAGVALACGALAIGESASAAPDVRELPHGPTWIARIARLGVRTRPPPDGQRIELHLEHRAATRLIELERIAGWVRIEAHFASAVVAGWVRDTDLALP